MGLFGKSKPAPKPLTKFQQRAMKINANGDKLAMVAPDMGYAYTSNIVNQRIKAGTTIKKTIKSSETTQEIAVTTFVNSTGAVGTKKKVTYNTLVVNNTYINHNNKKGFNSPRDHAWSKTTSPVSKPL